VVCRRSDRDPQYILSIRRAVRHIGESGQPKEFRAWAGEIRHSRRYNAMDQ
jgi:hypothetical protein